VDPIEFKNNKKIVREYSKLNLSAEDVRAYIEDGTMPEKGEEEDELTIVKIGRAREMCEMYKIADIASMTNEAMDEGYNVAIFLNYTESIEELTALLDCKAIYGATHPDDRDEYIEQFQNDEAHCLVLNSATGGTGISLHDVQGKRPRLSLISPSFNAKEFSQVIGRIHRNGAKSDALQKVLLAHDSIEEYVMTAINRKLQNMKLIHDSEPCKLTSTHY
jgi:SNF2 family DNA or RNA helicase